LLKGRAGKGEGELGEGDWKVMTTAQKMKKKAQKPSTRTG
jgi:hypothetical protein